jgi:site-specific DNA-methyltransferase (adenine-specific)
MKMNYRLFEGDCLDILPTLEAGSIDAIVTDPPYGVDFRGQSWDAFIPAWLNEARRVAKVVVFTTAPLTMWDYPKPDWVNCWYREASNSRAVSGGFNHWSPILVYGKVKFPVDSIKLHAIQHAYPRGFPHPSPKPEALLRWLVRIVAPVGGTVLDPFMGSGTTGVACQMEGRSFVGIELDPGYFEIAKRRIEQVQPALVEVMA